MFSFDILYQICKELNKYIKMHTSYFKLNSTKTCKPIFQLTGCL